MISLTQIHEKNSAAIGLRAASSDAPACRLDVLAAGTGEGVSLARVLAEREPALIRVCRGALAVGEGVRLCVGEALLWPGDVPVRVADAPVQVLVVRGPESDGVLSVYARDTFMCRAFDDVTVAWLAGDAAATASRSGELLRLARDPLDAHRSARGCIAYGARFAMGESIDAPKTIPELAQACGTSPTVLKESFRREFGLPVYDWYRRLRMLRASELLAGDQHAVGEVARLVGYANASKFARAFADCMGVAPSAYRAA